MNNENSPLMMLLTFVVGIIITYIVFNLLQFIINKIFQRLVEKSPKLAELAPTQETKKILYFIMIISIISLSSIDYFNIYLTIGIIVVPMIITQPIIYLLLKLESKSIIIHKTLSFFRTIYKKTVYVLHEPIKLSR